MTKKNNKHGGARPGAGRPKTSQPTVTLSWRVPASIAPALRNKIDALVKKEKARMELDQNQQV